jgi:hypothetical protein
LYHSHEKEHQGNLNLLEDPHFAGISAQSPHLPFAWLQFAQRSFFTHLHDDLLSMHLSQTLLEVQSSLEWLFGALQPSQRVPEMQALQFALDSQA